MSHYVAQIQYNSRIDGNMITCYGMARGSEFEVPPPKWSNNEDQADALPKSHQYVTYNESFRPIGAPIFDPYPMIVAYQYLPSFTVWIHLMWTLCKYTYDMYVITIYILYILYMYYIYIIYKYIYIYIFVYFIYMSPKETGSLFSGFTIWFTVNAHCSLMFDSSIMIQPYGPQGAAGSEARPMSASSKKP